MSKRRTKDNTIRNVIIIFFILLLLLIGIQNNIGKPAFIDTNRADNTEPNATVPTPIPIDTTTTTDNNGTIKMAAFNLQIFGTTKASKPEVMSVLSKIIRNYDIIAVQEIRDSSQTALPMLRDAVNSMGNPSYDYIVSERLGRTTSKEQYAYIYNTQTIQQIGYPYTYPDANDRFQREPYVAEFKS